MRDQTLPGGKAVTGQVPPRGRWSYGPDGTGAPIFIEAPDFGTTVTPTHWLPMTGPGTPAFPDSVGALLSKILNGADPPGPGPHTHTFKLPPTEYDEDGEPIPPRIQPSLTITRILTEIRAEAQAFATGVTGRLLLYGPDIDERLWNHDIDRCLKAHKAKKGG
jgi:hypothetical protein